MHSINKFICPYCDYYEVVSGREYKNLWSLSGYATFICNNCNRLTETECQEKILTSEIVDGKYKSIFRWENNEAVCLWCNENKLTKWHKSEPICPKCGSEMVEDTHKYLNLKMISIEKINEFINGSKLNILFLSANSCAPCKVRLPIFDEIAGELKNEYFGLIDFGVHELDEKNQVEDYFEQITNTNTIPTVFVFKNGALIDVISENINKPLLLARLKKIISTINS